METPLAGRLFFFLPRPTLQLFLEKVIFHRHRRSSAQSRRSVSPSLRGSAWAAPCGRSRAKHDTPPKEGGQRESTKCLSEWKKSEGRRKNRSRYFCSPLKHRCWTVAEDEEGDDDDGEEEESTMRHGCNKRDEHLDSSHSVAPALSSTAPPNFDLRHSDPGGWISPPPETRGNFSAPKPPQVNENTPAQKFLGRRRCVALYR